MFATVATSSAPDSLAAIPWESGAASGSPDEPTMVALPSAPAALATAPGGGALVVCEGGAVLVVRADGAVSAELSLPAGRSVAHAACSAGLTRGGARVAAAVSAAGGALHLDVVCAAASGVVHLATAALAAPADGAAPCGVAASSAAAYVLWSDGTVEAFPVPPEGERAAAVPVERGFSRTFRGVVPAGCGEGPAAGKKARGKRTRDNGPAGGAGGAALCCTEEGYVAVCGTVRGEGTGLSDGATAVVVFDSRQGSVHAVAELAGAEASVTFARTMPGTEGEGPVCAVGTQGAVLTVPFPRHAPTLARALALRASGGDPQAAVFGTDGGGGAEAVHVAVPVITHDLSGLALGQGVAEGATAVDDVAAAASPVLNAASMAQFEVGFRKAVAKVTAATSAPAIDAAVKALLKLHGDNGASVGPSAAAAVVGHCVDRGAWGALAQVLGAVAPGSVPQVPGAVEKALDSGNLLALSSLLSASASVGAADLALLLERLLADEAGAGPGGAGPAAPKRRGAKGRGSAEAEFREAALAAAEGALGAAEAEGVAGPLGSEAAVEGVGGVTHVAPAVVAAVAAGCAARALDARGGCVAAALVRGDDPATVLRAVESLPRACVARLLALLDRLLRIYRDHPVLLSVPGEHVPALPAPLALPSLQGLCSWAGATLDAHLPRILLHGGSLRGKALRLRGTVAGLSGSVGGVVALEGHLSHLLDGAPLPAPRDTIAAQYHVEALSLQIEA